VSGSYNTFILISQRTAKSALADRSALATLRLAIEKLLICYDWAESFVALNLVLKPLLDEVFMSYLSDSSPA